MIDIRDPEIRRGIRTIVQASVQFSLLIFVWLLIHDLNDPSTLKSIALSALAIIAIDEVGYVMENGVRAFRISANKSGVSIDANSNSDNNSPDNSDT